ncbi:C39 family peptidase [Halomonas denitrificans]|uniref:C39 family peptidase n=1 Tax=Halomonas TaxID=2745 RepID=UPI001A8DC849|nr:MULTISPECIES: C39 family peptidase [Halomonas]MED5295117.1 C39 family peptidase [Pseudomonadota bacterium]MBN8412231.1 C39 family peptidase [Halomonas litopenaei]MBY5924507.1 C39 family peptidase [Halomonas sp. DP4Y7-2]MBY5929782.1 C39 family peptidase [Halomonas sp. DP8Y7-3]MBY5968468.1 C39 family peptidase [Halomonas denitrificans]
MTLPRWSLATAIALGLALPALDGHAATIRLGGIVPGTVINKDVQSIRERRYENLVEQRTDFSCGAASLATLLKYAYQMSDTTEHDVLAGMLEVADLELVQQQGFSLLDLKNYVETLGLRGRGYEVDGDTLDQVSIPVIVLLDLNGYRHFVVMKKASGDRVYIGDPALGNRVMTRDDFLAAWNNIIFAVVGDGFDRYTALLDPRQPLTAHRMKDVFSPVSREQMIDFGFRHAELF